MNSSHSGMDSTGSVKRPKTSGGDGELERLEAFRSSSKALEVLDLPELLEQILFRLSNLSVEDLGLAQGVNTLWKSLIEDSTTLQRALFLSRAPITSVLIWKESDTEGWQPEISTDPATFDQGRIIIDLNPRLRYEPTLPFPKTYTEFVLKYATHNQSLWNRSYLTQPPCTKLRFAVEFDESDEDEGHHDDDDDSSDVAQFFELSGGAVVSGSGHFDLTAADGITLGMLDEALRKLWPEYEGTARLKCEIVGQVDANSPHVLGRQREVAARLRVIKKSLQDAQAQYNFERDYAAAIPWLIEGSVEEAQSKTLKRLDGLKDYLRRAQDAGKKGKLLPLEKY